MQPAPGETLQTPPCEHCGTALQRDAQYCVSCGARVKPPTQCPSCEAAVAKGARFCASCGVRLVGARPSATRPAQGAQDALRQEQATLPKAAPRPATGSSLLANVLAFLALLAALLVGIYVMNRGKPKEATMFSGGPPPPATNLPEEKSASPTGPEIGGRIVLADPDAPPSGGVLFITARRAGQSGGPPLAVLRVPDPSFPHAFRLGDQNMMIPGMKWEGPLDVTARWDADGDALTKGNADRAAEPMTGVALGELDLRIELR